MPHNWREVAVQPVGEVVVRVMRYAWHHRREDCWTLERRRQDRMSIRLGSENYILYNAYFRGVKGVKDNGREPSL